MNGRMGRRVWISVAASIILITIGSWVGISRIGDPPKAPNIFAEENPTRYRDLDLAALVGKNAEAAFAEARYPQDARQRETYEFKLVPLGPTSAVDGLPLTELTVVSGCVAYVETRPLPVWFGVVSTGELGSTELSPEQRAVFDNELLSKTTCSDTSGGIGVPIG